MEYKSKEKGNSTHVHVHSEKPTSCTHYYNINSTCIWLHLNQLLSHNNSCFFTLNPVLLFASLLIYGLAWISLSAKVSLCICPIRKCGAPCHPLLIYTATDSALQQFILDNACTFSQPLVLTKKWSYESNYIPHVQCTRLWQNNVTVTIDITTCAHIMCVHVSVPVLL